MRLLELLILGTPRFIWKHVRPLFPPVRWRTVLESTGGPCVHGWIACTYSAHTGRTCRGCGRVDVAEFVPKSER